MKRTFPYFTVLLLLFLFLPPLSALEIKLASPAPEQSPWGAALNQLASDWLRISGGSVRLRIYHNGVAGSETDVLRKLRINQIQAAVLTSSGMKQVVPEVFALSTPFLIRSEETLQQVMAEVQPDLDAAFDRSRLTVLAWSQAGWIHFFSREPVTYPSDLQALRLASDPADQELAQAFTTMGFYPIPISPQEVITALNSRMIDAFYSSPVGAAGYQWFALAPNMLDLKVAPFMGSIVVSNSVWRRIDDDIKPALLRSARSVAAEIDRDVALLETDAIDTMKRYGLHVEPVPPEVEHVWLSYVQRYDDELLNVFDPEMIGRIRSIMANHQQ